MNVYGLIELLGGRTRADRNLILIGIVVGTMSAALYVWAFRRWRATHRVEATVSARSRDR